MYGTIDFGNLLLHIQWANNNFDCIDGDTLQDTCTLKIISHPSISSWDVLGNNEEVSLNVRNLDHDSLSNFMTRKSKENKQYTIGKLINFLETLDFQMTKWPHFDYSTCLTMGIGHCHIKCQYFDKGTCEPHNPNPQQQMWHVHNMTNIYNNKLVYKLEGDMGPNIQHPKLPKPSS